MELLRRVGLLNYLSSNLKQKNAALIQEAVLIIYQGYVVSRARAWFIWFLISNSQRIQSVWTFTKEKKPLELSVTMLAMIEQAECKQFISTLVKITDFQFFCLGRAIAY